MLQPTWIETLFPRGDSFRLEIWGAEWQRLIENGPWFGLGVLVPDDVVLQGEVFVHPHSLYLASALQGGLVGLLLLLGVLFYTGLNLYRARRQDGAPLGLALLATGMTAYLLDGWELIDKVSVSWLLLWTPVAIAVGVRSKNAESTRDPGTGPNTTLDRSDRGATVTIAGSVAVVVVNFNGAAYLRRCLSSIEAQTHRPDHVIVVDNASADESLRDAQSQSPGSDTSPTTPTSDSLPRTIRRSICVRAWGSNTWRC